MDTPAREGVAVVKVGSLFSGIGGLDLGLERAGMAVVFQCESDPWRRKVLRERFNGTPCCEDVREVISSWPGSSCIWRDARPHVLCGGFPCQDVSIAGKRAGLAGERTGLFWEFIRVARSIRPPFVLLENVPGLLTSHAGRDFGAVLGALVELGYGVAWRILDSRFFGVPQRRRRVFVLGVLADGDTRAASERAAEILSVGSRCERHPATVRQTREDVAVASLSGLGSGGPDDNDGQAGRIVTAPAMIRRMATATGGTQDEMTIAVVNALIAGPLGGGNDGIGRRSEDDPNLVAQQGVRRLTPTECERLQSLPDNWTALGADSKRYAALGDAVTTNVAEWIGRRIMAAP